MAAMAGCELSYDEGMPGAELGDEELDSTTQELAGVLAGEEQESEGLSKVAESGQGVLCAAQMTRFPVNERHNTGYDTTYCTPTYCSLYCPPSAQTVSNSDYHGGIDIFADPGAPVVAAQNGTISYTFSDTSGGIVVYIVDDCGWNHYYAHLQGTAPGIQIGSYVTAGTLIGYVGNTGNAAGTQHHLHYGLYDGGWTAYNPFSMLYANEASSCGGGGSNNADVLLEQSTVPSSMAPGETRTVTIRVTNNGTTTWTAGNLYRLGATTTNNVIWGGFTCGGFADPANVTNARAYLCSNVAPGQSHDFTFTITAPSSGTATLGVRMVQDLVEWYGETGQWSIPLATACSTTAKPRVNDRWLMRIWDNATFTGSPSDIRYGAPTTGGFTHNWGLGSPSSCVAPDTFSVVFVRDAYFSTSGNYMFTTTTDDGVKLLIDDNVIINKWYDQAPTSHSAVYYMTAGWHKVMVRYYENGGGAYAALDWSPYNPYPNCPCNQGDNYCNHGPSTPGCPMTFPGGYCDPNGNGSYDDANWTQGWYEYQDYCQ
jgi:hypothetical protein